MPPRPALVRCACGAELEAPPLVRMVRCGECNRLVSTAAPAGASRPAPSSSRLASAGAALRKVGTGRSYAFLLLALIPLAMNLMTPTEEVWTRVDRSMELLPEEEQVEFFDRAQAGNVDGALSMLPNGKLSGAHLARRTRMHWVYAGLSLAAFLSVVLFAFPRGDASLPALLGAAAFTGVAGVSLLLGVQWVADHVRFGLLWAQGPLLVLALILRFIAFSYGVLDDPDASAIMTFFGYTFGVGFCEEACKIIPIAWAAKRLADGEREWSTAVALGFASGVGFGVSEGIHYAGELYNGLLPSGIYAVRFISCVGLHAVWSGSAALAYVRRSHMVTGSDGLLGLLANVFVVLVGPIVLHGLYDTALHKELPLLAIAVALASFGYFFWTLHRAGARLWSSSGVEPVSA